jgi:hypothetical protein
LRRIIAGRGPGLEGTRYGGKGAEEVEVGVAGKVVAAGSAGLVGGEVYF